MKVIFFLTILIFFNTNSEIKKITFDTFMVDDKSLINLLRLECRDLKNDTKAVISKKIKGTDVIKHLSENLPLMVIISYAYFDEVFTFENCDDLEALLIRANKNKCVYLNFYLITCKKNSDQKIDSKDWCVIL